MKTFVAYYTLLCVILLFFSCGSKDQFEAAFDYSKPVDFSEIQVVYDYHKEHEGEENDTLVFSYLEANLPSNTIIYLFDDTSFSLKTPEYATSNHPFLSKAEELYNEFVWGWNVWSDFEVWYRGNTADLLLEDEDVKNAIRKMDTDILKDEEIRLAAKKCQDSLLALIEIPVDDWSEGTQAMDDYLIPYINLVGNKSYSVITDWDAYKNSYDSISNLLDETVSKSYALYLNATEEEQLNVILRELNSCKNFDEQCALWMLWPTRRKSLDETEWIVAVGERLLESGCYTPILSKVWFTWRALCQSVYYGFSRDSCIPNQYYNQMRKRCYLTCLKRIQSHPDDIFAMNCAYNLVQVRNLDRYGLSDLGNNAITEMYMMLPNRYKE